MVLLLIPELNLMQRDNCKLIARRSKALVLAFRMQPQADRKEERRQLQPEPETYRKQAPRKDVQAQFSDAQLVKTSGNISRPPTTIGAADSKIGVAVRKIGAADSKIGAAVRKSGAADSKIGAAVRKSGAADSKIGAAVSTIGAAGFKIGAAGSKMGAAVSNIRAAGSKIGAAGSKIGAAGSKNCWPGDVQQKLERVSTKKSPNHWRKEIQQWVCSSTGIVCAELVQMMLCENSRTHQCQCLRYCA